jgi:hypothetical protein
MTDSVLDVERPALRPRPPAQASLAGDCVSYYNDLFSSRLGESARAIMDEADPARALAAVRAP